MILVLKDADFSANNIGQVEVSRDLNAYTVAAITASGNENLTDAQKFALDDLFLAMGVDGSNQVMSKIKCLYIPMIADDISNALINYATNSFTKDFTPNSANWQLRSHGITQKASGQTFSKTFSTPLLGTNVTHMWLRTENMETGVDDTCCSLVLRGKTTTTKFLLYKEKSAGGSSQDVLEWGDNTYGFNMTSKSIAKTTDQRITAGYSIRSASDYTIKFYDSTTARTITVVTDMEGESSQTLYALGVGDQAAPKPYGFMLLGEGISETDFNNIAAKVDALFRAISA